MNNQPGAFAVIVTDASLEFWNFTNTNGSGANSMRLGLPTVDKSCLSSGFRIRCLPDGPIC